jgi:hypothetical protein
LILQEKRNSTTRNTGNKRKDSNILTYHIQYNEIDIIDNRYRNKLKWYDRISDIVSWSCELQDNVE